MHLQLTVISLGFGGILSMNRIHFLFGSLLCLMAFTPAALSSSLKSDDKAPLFLFVLNSSKSYSRALAGDAGQLQLQIPREEISSVQMYSDRSGEVFTELRQPAVRNLWKSLNLELKHPAKATLLTSQSASQIIEILGHEVTPS